MRMVSENSIYHHQSDSCLQQQQVTGLQYVSAIIHCWMFLHGCSDSSLVLFGTVAVGIGMRTGMASWEHTCSNPCTRKMV